MVVGRVVAVVGMDQVVVMVMVTVMVTVMVVIVMTVVEPVTSCSALVTTRAPQ